MKTEHERGREEFQRLLAEGQTRQVERIDPGDHGRLQIAELRIQVAQKDHQILIMELARHYGLVDGDRIMADGTIMRVAQPDVPKENGASAVPG